MAVDASGDVFVADSDNSRVVELSPGADGKLSDGTQATLPITGLGYTEGVAVDGFGDVFAADGAKNQIVELASPLWLSPAAAQAVPGDAIDFMAEAFDTSGDDLGDVTASTKFSIVPDGSGSATGASCLAFGCQATAAGTYLVTGRYLLAGTPPVTGSTTMIVVPGQPTSLTLSPVVATVAPGVWQVFQSEGFDSYGNDAGDVTAVTSFSIAPSGGTGSSVGASCSGDACSATVAGTYKVTGTDGSATGNTTLTVTPGAVDAADSTVAASPGSVPADGSSTATGTADVTATINGQAVGTGATVHFTLADRSLPVISGTAQDGLVLSRGVGVWSSGKKLTYSQQWERCTSGGLDCVAIPGAIGTVYRATSADVGDEVTVVVTATDTGAQTATATAAPTGVVADPEAPVATSLPAFTGTAQAGQVLTLSSRGRWSSPDALGFSVQWERCDDTGANCTAIDGATRFVYRLTAADAGGQVTVAVTATDTLSQQTTATAAPTAVAGPS